MKIPTGFNINIWAGEGGCGGLLRNNARRKRYGVPMLTVAVTVKAYSIPKVLEKLEKEVDDFIKRNQIGDVFER